MRIYPIAFPNFNISVLINPIAISIFGLDIYWYGIIIVSAILIGLTLAKHDDGLHNIKFDDAFDFILIAIFIGILFARLYYVLFSMDYYIENPEKIFQIWNGGLAIYGGIIGGALTAVFFCKAKKIGFLDLCDYFVPFLVFGQGIGRWGNFINQEAYGSATETFLKMKIFSEELSTYINVHPTFLYESFFDFIIFIVLMLIRKKRKFEGQLLFLYLIMYGSCRALIEGLRIDSLMMGNFRVSQFLSAVLVIISAILYFCGDKCRTKDKKKD